MKIFFFSVCITFCCLGAMAQQIRYFEYDRQLVSSVVESISETTIAVEGNNYHSIFFADTVINRSKFFWTGFTGGTIGCIAGVGLGYLGGEVMSLGTGFGWAGVVIGALLGIVIPQAIVHRKTGDPKNYRKALLGSTTAVGTSAVCLIAIFVLAGL